MTGLTFEEAAKNNFSVNLIGSLKTRGRVL
jgi:hypothetical protein